MCAASGRHEEQDPVGMVHGGVNSVLIITLLCTDKLKFPALVLLQLPVKKK